eukprot:812395-Amphidinium_carterae.1
MEQSQSTLLKEQGKISRTELKIQPVLTGDHTPMLQCDNRLTHCIATTTLLVTPQGSLQPKVVTCMHYANKPPAGGEGTAHQTFRASAVEFNPNIYWPCRGDTSPEEKLTDMDEGGLRR